MRTYLIVYLTRKKEIIYRLVKWLPEYEKNTYTSMGWYIVDIQAYYNGCFHSLDTVEKNIETNIEKRRKNDKKLARKNILKRKIRIRLKRIIEKI